MTLIEFVNAEIDSIDEIDIRNGYYMMELLGNDEYEINSLPSVSLNETLLKSIGTFKLYKSSNVYDKLHNDVYNMNIGYMPIGYIPFFFNTQILAGANNTIIPTIIYPSELDKASYAFLGHEYNHCLKDTNLKERRIRDRVSEVIPMFYEIMCADKEMDEDVSKEIMNRRLFLLQLDKEENTDDKVRQLQYFNSYYYALALHNKFKDNKILILRLIERVLLGEISTLDLLNMLNIYDKDLDYEVSYELERIKQYILG